MRWELRPSQNSRLRWPVSTRRERFPPSSVVVDLRPSQVSRLRWPDSTRRGRRPPPLVAVNLRPLSKVEEAAREGRGAQAVRKRPGWDGTPHANRVRCRELYSRSRHFKLCVIDRSPSGFFVLPSTLSVLALIKAVQKKGRTDWPLFWDPRLDLVLKLTPPLRHLGHTIKASTHTVRTLGESYCNLNSGYSNAVAEEKRGLEWNGEGCYST